MVEQLPFKQMVTGSNPVRRTSIKLSGILLIDSAAEFRISLCGMRRLKTCKNQKKMYSNYKFEMQDIILKTGELLI